MVEVGVKKWMCWELQEVKKSITIDIPMGSYATNKDTNESAK